MDKLSEMEINKKINKKFDNVYENVGYKKAAFDFNVRKHVVACMEYTGVTFKDATEGIALGQDGLHIDMYSMKHVAAICYVERSLEDEISSLAELNDFEDEPEKMAIFRKEIAGLGLKKMSFGGFAYPYSFKNGEIVSLRKLAEKLYH